jgi:hypothetical protein
MTKRFVFAAVLIGLALTPVVLAIGALVLLPLAIVVLPVVAVGAVFAAPALLLSATRDREPRAVVVGPADGAHRAVTATNA